MSDEMREAFEKVGRQHGNDFSSVNGLYLNDDTAAAWEEFQLGHYIATAAAGAKYLPVIEKATALCNQMSRDGYQNAKLDAVRELRESLAAPLLKKGCE